MHSANEQPVLTRDYTYSSSRLWTFAHPTDQVLHVRIQIATDRVDMALHSHPSKYPDDQLVDIEQYSLRDTRVSGQPVWSHASPPLAYSDGRVESTRPLSASVIDQGPGHDSACWRCTMSDPPRLLHVNMLILRLLSDFGPRLSSWPTGKCTRGINQARPANAVRRLSACDVCPVRRGGYHTVSVRSCRFDASAPPLGLVAVSMSRTRSPGQRI